MAFPALRSARRFFPAAPHAAALESVPPGVRSLALSRNRNRIITPRPEPAVKMEEKFGIVVDRNPSEYRLADLRCWTWHKWECDPCKFPWKYEYQETSYFLKGKARIYPEDPTAGYLEINSGDLVIFPKGLICTWDVTVGIDKFYRLHAD